MSFNPIYGQNAPSETSIEHRNVWQHHLMPLVATNTNPVLFYISMRWYRTVFTGENLQVFQSHPSCFQQPLDEILSRIDFRKILFSVRHWLLNRVICSFWKSIRKQRFYSLLNVMVHYFFTEYGKIEGTMKISQCADFFFISNC